MRVCIRLPTLMNDYGLERRFNLWNSISYPEQPEP
jgi:hypothetical protein